MTALEAQLAKQEKKRATSRKQQQSHASKAPGDNAAAAGSAEPSESVGADSAAAAADASGGAEASADAPGPASKTVQHGSRKGKAVKAAASDDQQAVVSPAESQDTEQPQQQQAPGQQLGLQLGDVEPQQTADARAAATAADLSDDDADLALQGSSWAEIIKNYNALLDDSESSDSDSDSGSDITGLTAAGAETSKLASSGWAARWRAGVKAKDVPKAAVMSACAELVLRIEDEQHRQQQARLFGVVQVSSRQGPSVEANSR